MAGKKGSSSKANKKPEAKDISEDDKEQATETLDASEDSHPDSETIDVTPEDVTGVSEDTVEASEAEGVVDAEIVEDVADPDEGKDAAEEEPVENASDDAPAPQTDPEPAPPPVTAPVPVVSEQQSGGGFAPMLLGGVLAGAIGFGAAYLALPRSGGDESFQQDITASLKQNSDQIAGLSETVAALPEAPDLTNLTNDVSDLGASMDALLTRLEEAEAQFSDFDQRLTDVEKRPISEGASDAAVAAYERELKALQDAMAAQRAEIEAMTAEAQTMETNAEETAKATLRRAALSQVKTALDTGVGFAPAVQDLKAADVEVPAALTDVADAGVPSLAQLQDSFPDAARAALGVSRQDAANQGQESGLSAFLKNQLGTRSLEPREGDDPDAVLSRAEAAVREGRLADALSELDALPEVGRTELSDWTTQVALRLEAVSAAASLSEELN